MSVWGKYLATGPDPREVESFSYSKKYLVAANLKSTVDKAKLQKIIKEYNSAGPIPAWVEAVFCPPSLYLEEALKTMRSDVAIGAQDCSANGYGAHTGEIAAEMLKDFGVKWVILGHSERRTNQKESSELIATKTRKAIDAGLQVMYCVGETLEEREAGKINAVVLDDHMAAFKGKFSDKEWDSIAIAYEPVWAIGTGKTATPDQAQEVHASIRAWLATNVSQAVSKKVRIQYGGSMKAANATELLSQPDVDGGLIGSASLKPEFITGIVAKCPKP
mmetsp:Transcript_7082/g.10571  ORF Transcript_7082/g.10571 Transcript_7082/m.10571 type:complete len:276 (+) Transcript_7082:34-861(+)